jgi:hypothetical protein
MDNRWLSDQSWVIRDNTDSSIRNILAIGDTLTLEANRTSGQPQFFLLHYTGQHSFWDGAVFYPVGVTAPQITLHYAWNDSLPLEEQDPDCRKDYSAAAAALRGHANDPQIAKLLGYVPVNGHFAIVTLFCFQGAQTDGKDWFAVDSQWSVAQTRQDGTAHGDPP